MRETIGARQPTCARRLVRMAAVLAASLAASAVHASELLVSDFNFFSPTYDFGSLESTPGSAFLRVSGPSDFGGVGTNASLDLSSFGEGRFVVDLFKNPGNTVGAFDLELLDTSDNAGKWRINVSTFGDSTPTQLVAATTLNNPVSGNNFANLDLSNIRAWQIVGTFGNPTPFDISFDNLLISNTVAPPPAYPGAEPGAAWRAEAATRIADHRMADLSVRVTDAAGVALPGAAVSVRMQEHEFGFGSAVRAASLIDSGADNEIYRGKVEELFNLVVIENNLKWEPWAGEWGPNWTQARARQAIDWLAARDIRIRGHNLVWPGIENVANPAKNRLDDFVENGTPLTAAEQTQLKALITAHIADIATEFSGEIDSWDVVNEARSNNDVFNALPEGELVMLDWFHQARAIDPNASLFLNEFDIVAGGGVDTAPQQDYFDRAQFLLDNGAPLDGLGFQSHFREGSLTGPEQVWEILDRYETLGIDLKITEFDFETTDEELQAQYTRDFMTAVFAHEGVSDFLHWGFWEGAHWRPDAALFRQDWSIKPNGEAYLDLVFDEWWTDEDLLSEEGGVADLRGFKGQYEVTVNYNGVEVVVPATLTEGGLVLDVSLDLLAGDFNNDGVVNAADYTVWRDGLGTTYDQSHYVLWAASLGAVAAGQSTAVPEPATAWLTVSLAAAATLGRRRLTRSVGGGRLPF